MNQPNQPSNVKMPVGLGQQLADDLQAEIARLKAKIQHKQNMLNALGGLQPIAEEEEPAPTGVKIVETPDGTDPPPGATE